MVIKIQLRAGSNVCRHRLAEVNLDLIPSIEYTHGQSKERGRELSLSSYWAAFPWRSLAIRFSIASADCCCCSSTSWTLADKISYSCPDPCAISSARPVDGQSSLSIPQRSFSIIFYIQRCTYKRISSSKHQRFNLKVKKEKVDWWLDLTLDGSRSIENGNVLIWNTSVDGLTDEYRLGKKKQILNRVEPGLDTWTRCRSIVST